MVVHTIHWIRCQSKQITSKCVLRPFQDTGHGLMDLIFVSPAMKELMNGGNRRYIDIPYGESWVNPLREVKSPLSRSGDEKKDPLRRPFFLTSLWPVLPLGQCSPSKSLASHPTCLHKSLCLQSKCLNRSHKYLDKSLPSH